MRSPKEKNESFNKGTQGIDDGSLDSYVGRAAAEGGIYRPKAIIRTASRLAFSRKVWFLIVISALAYFGYKFGDMTAAFSGSDRPAFFAMVGGYAAILLLVSRSAGIFGALIIAGLVELFGHLYLGGSLHQYLFRSF